MLNLVNVYQSHATIRPKKSCLVVCHHPPPILKNWEKVFTVQKYTAPNFQNSKKGFFFFLLEFSGFEFTVLIFLLSICLHWKTGLNLYEEIYW